MPRAMQPGAALALLALAQVASAQEAVPDHHNYKPASLIAVAGDSEAKLTWQPVPGVDRYEIQRRLGLSKSAKEKGFTTIARDITGTSFVDAKTRNGTAYYYTLSAVGPDGAELESNPAKATPVSRPAPGSVKWPLSGSAAADADGVAFQYGPRKVGRSYDFHAGIDIPAKIGTPVYPVMDGEVTAIEEWEDGKRGAGNRVLIKHGEQKWTGYLHLDDFAPGLQVGQKVEAGKTLIGYVGKTGAVSEHLHLTYMVGLQSEKTSEMRSKNPLEILPHTPPGEIAIAFSADNRIEITLPAQHMTARWIMVEGEGQTRLVDYYQVVEQGKKRDTQTQSGLHLEATGLPSPFDARSSFRLLVRPEPVDAFKVEQVRLIDFDGKTIAEGRRGK